MALSIVFLSDMFIPKVQPAQNFWLKKIQF